jgi:hypothetical protein
MNNLLSSQDKLDYSIRYWFTIIFSVYIVDERFPDIYNSYFDKPLLELAIATKTINGNPEIRFLSTYHCLQALKKISNSR